MSSDAGNTALDQGFRAFGSKLLTKSAPRDPTRRTGDKRDSAVFVATPGVDFQRPWLAVQDGPAFQWPMGTQTFSLTNDAKLGIHTFLGDDDVRVDVLHLGEEHIVLSGSFPGNSAPDLIQALRTVVRADPGKSGSKILYVPGVLPYAVRCQVLHSEFSRADTDRGFDSAYSVEFVFVGVPATKTTTTSGEQTSTTSGTKGRPSRSVSVNAAHRTLRQLAAWRLGSKNNWRQLYDANQDWFTAHNVSAAKAPTYRLPLGLTLFY